jgi:integrase-like protein
MTSRCPQLRRPGGGWSSGHGVWWYQTEIPRGADGKRRQLKRGGFTTAAETQAELDQLRRLLDLAGTDKDLRSQIGDLLIIAIRDGTAFPDETDIRSRARRGISLAEAPTTGAYLSEWISQLEAGDDLAGSTIRSYDSHIRKHLIPQLGDIPLDTLRPRHVRAMFIAIIEHNQQLEADRTSDNPVVRAAVLGLRATGSATRHRIRATLRNALNCAMVDELVTMNAAARTRGSARPAGTCHNTGQQDGIPSWPVPQALDGQRGRPSRSRSFGRQRCGRH